MDKLNFHGFTQEDADNLIPLVDLLVDYQVIARRDGLLSLSEYIAAHEKNEFMRIVLMAAGNNFAPDELELLGQFLTRATGYGYTDYTTRLEWPLIIQGAKHIVNGEYPPRMKELLLALLDKRS